MSTFKFKINVNLPQLLYFVVSAAQNGEFERFGGFCVDCCFTLALERSKSSFPPLFSSYYVKQQSTQNPPNRSNSPFWAAETTKYNSWGRFTFILNLNIDITRNKSTIIRPFQNPHTFLYMYFEHTCTNSHAACMGPLWKHTGWALVGQRDVCAEVEWNPKSHVLLSNATLQKFLQWSSSHWLSWVVSLLRIFMFNIYRNNQ